MIVYFDLSKPGLERIKKHIGIYLVQGLKLRKPVSFREFLCAGFCIVFFILCGEKGQAQSVFTATDIRFEGLKRTKVQIVMRERTFNIGQAILVNDTAQIFRRFTFNVFNTHLFNYAVYSIDSLKIDSLGHSSGIVKVRVSERWYTFPSPIFELADRNFNEWWYDRNHDLRRVNVGIRFVQHNVRGRNEDLVAVVQEGFTRRYELGYSFPYINKAQTMGLKVGASYANNRDVATRTVENRLVYHRDETSFGRQRWSANSELSRRVNIYEYQYLGFAYNYNRISDSTLAKNANYFGDNRQFQRFFELKFTWVSDHRNLRNFATKGYYITGFAGKIGLAPTDNFRVFTVRLTGAKFLHLAARWFWASKLDAEFSTPAKQPYYGSRAMGYENRFARGYERYVVEGHINTYTRNTLRFKALSKILFLKWLPVKQFQFIPLDIYLTGLCDAGYIVNPLAYPENERLSNTLLVGYGLGINIVTFYDVVFRAEYSLTRQGDKGLYLSFLSDI